MWESCCPNNSYIALSTSSYRVTFLFLSFSGFGICITADVIEVHESASAFREVEETTADLRGLLDCLCRFQWITAGMKATARSRFETPMAATFSRNPTDAYRILARRPDTRSEGGVEVYPGHWAMLEPHWREARDIARREGFLH